MRTYREGLLFACNVLSRMRDQIGDFSQTCDNDAAVQRALDAARAAIAARLEAPIAEDVLVERLRSLVYESLFHLRLDDRARAYHDKAAAELRLAHSEDATHDQR